MNQLKVLYKIGKGLLHREDELADTAEKGKLVAGLIREIVGTVEEDL